jgi:hypothetical protein
MALTAKSPEKVRKDIPLKAIEQGMRVRINFEVAEATRKRWKTAAIERDTTLAELVETAVNEYLSK